MKPTVFIGVEQPQTQNQPTYAWHIPTSNQGATIGVHPPKQDTQTQPPTDSQQAIVSLVHEMQKVKTDTPEAKLNKDSMSDNNGGRITFNDELTKSQTFKGVEDPTRLPNKKR